MLFLASLQYCEAYSQSVQVIAVHLNISMNLASAVCFYFADGGAKCFQIWEYIPHGRK